MSNTNKTPLSVALSERDDALNQLTGWENKWKAAVEMAANAEKGRDEAIAMVEKLMEHGFDMMDQNKALKREIKQLKKK